MTRQPFPALVNEHDNSHDYYQILNLPSPTTTTTTGSPTPLSMQQLKLAYHRALLQNHPDKAGLGIIITEPAAPAAQSHITRILSTSSSTSPDSAPNTTLHPSIPTSSTEPQPQQQRQESRQRRRGRIYTIDEITTAYKTLSDPSLRAEYDRTLRLDRRRGAAAISDVQNGGDALFRTGLEVVDLEDLKVEEDATQNGQEQGEGERDGLGGMAWYRGCRCGDGKGFRVTEMELEREAEHGEIVVGCRGCSLWMKVLFAVEDG